jgi:hypothetical protein
MHITPTQPLPIDALHAKLRSYGLHRTPTPEYAEWRAGLGVLAASKVWGAFIVAALVTLGLEVHASSVICDDLATEVLSEFSGETTSTSLAECHTHRVFIQAGQLMTITAASATFYHKYNNSDWPLQRLALPGQVRIERRDTVDGNYEWNKLTNWLDYSAGSANGRYATNYKIKQAGCYRVRTRTDANKLADTLVSYDPALNGIDTKVMRAKVGATITTDPGDSCPSMGPSGKRF